MPRIAGVFLLAAVATNLIAFVIGSSRGLAPPPAFDFGNAQHLSRLSADASSHWLPLTLSLLSPVFAIPAGLGIYHVLKSAGWPALFGVVMFFVGMIFVVLLDVLARRHRARCARVRHRTRRRAAVDSGTGRHDRYRHRRARVRRTLLQFRPRPAAFGIAIIRVPGISNWLGGLAFIPGLIIGWLAPLIAFAGRSPAPVIGIGIIAFVTWLIGMVVVLLRWKPVAAAR